MKKKILFRADGNESVGLGHLYRLFAVVEMLKENYDFLFVTKSSSTTSVIPTSYEVHLIPDEVDIASEPNWLKDNFDSANYIIVGDGYQFDAAYQEKLKKLEYQLAYIDDLVHEHMFADIVINHAPSVKEDDYSAAKYTNFGLGVKFALLRPSFLQSTKNQRVINKTDTAFICFGGADMLNLSLKVTKALLKTAFTKTIHIVLGQAYKNDEILDLEKEGKTIHIHRNLSETELVSVMTSCNFAIVPTSTIFYELCCIKMPILGGYFVDNQKQIYAAMAHDNVIIEGGDFSQYSIADFQEVLEDKFRALDSNQYVEKQSAIFDGKSGQRILGLINTLNISFRAAGKSDLQRTFEWSSDEMVRKNSYHSEVITIKNHTKWFLNKIVSENTLFLIVLVNDQPAGVVRYENDTAAAVVGILIGKEYRGQNLASHILSKSAEIYFEKFENPVQAFIKKQNIASIKSFEKAGYTFSEEKEIQGHESYVYKLENVK